MSVVDIILLLFLVTAIMRGYKQGLWRGIINILSLGLALVLGIKLVAYIKDIWNWDYQGLGARGALLLIVIICSGLLSAILGRMISFFSILTPLGWVSSILGAVLNVMVWAVFWGGVALIAEHLGAGQIIEDSSIGSVLHQAALEGWDWLEKKIT